MITSVIVNRAVNPHNTAEYAMSRAAAGTRVPGGYPGNKLPG